MKTSFSSEQLTADVARQISYTFPDQEIKPDHLHRNIIETLERNEYCFSHLRDKYVFDGEQTVLNHLHSDGRHPRCNLNQLKIVC